MNGERRIVLFLLGCAVIGVISTRIDLCSHGSDYRGRSKAIIGFVPDAMGTESQPGRESQMGSLASPEVAIVVAPNGTILKEGRTWRGIGINYFSAFNRLIVNGDDTSSFRGLEVLAKHKIPFIRFACCGFWPND